MSDQKPRKWRFRMSIRVMMVAILVIALVTALFVTPAKRQEAAIGRITALGGVVGFDYNFWVERGNYPPWPSGDPPLPDWLRFGGLIGGKGNPTGSTGMPKEGPPVPGWLLKPLGPEFFRRANFVSVADLNKKLRPIPDLAFLADLPDVRVLRLDSRSFADAEMAYARSLKLIHFFANDSSLGDEGLAYLQDQAEMWWLELPRTRVTDAGLAYLARMPKLRFVDLSGLKITDAGLAHLAHLGELERLELAETAINGEGFAQLKDLYKLQVLNLKGTRLNDTGLAQFKNFPGLRGVSMSRTDVTDAGLVHLKAMPGLKYVELPKPGVTEQGVADLKQAMPKLIIDHR